MSCKRSFTTISGRGLHHRRAHKAWYDERVIQQATQPGQRRWTREETALLARREAELTIQGVRFINQALHESFPQRLVSTISNYRCSKDYRDMVQQAIHQQRVYVEIAPPTPPEPPTTRGPNRLLVYLRSLGALNSDDYHDNNNDKTTSPLARLDTIVNVALNSEDKEATFQSLSLYHRDILSSTPSNNTSPRRQPSAPPTFKRKARRREYATVQRHWKQNRARCIMTILEGIDDAQQPSRDIMEAYWTNVFTQPATNTKPHCVRRPPIEDVWQPIIPENIRAARPFLAVSPGPDGLTAR